MEVPEELREFRTDFVSPNKIKIKPSELHGYGIFAIEDIEEGEIIEDAVYVPTSYRSRDLTHYEIKEYCYALPCDCDECKHRGKCFVFAMGNVQLYNCSDSKEDASAYMHWRPLERVISVTALKDIKKEEEILTWYGSKYGTHRDSKQNSEISTLDENSIKKAVQDATNTALQNKMKELETSLPSKIKLSLPSE